MIRQRHIWYFFQIPSVTNELWDSCRGGQLEKGGGGEGGGGWEKKKKFSQMKTKEKKSCKEGKQRKISLKFRKKTHSSTSRRPEKNHAS